MFDVIVIGGGHAGCEAAAAAARRGAHVALVTMSAKTIGAMSCNPSIGGIGKGHIVREVDALDGLMGRAADRAAIHYRLLNRSKGRAVQGPRIQADRVHYARAVRAILDQQRHLTVVEGSVDALALSGRKVTGIIFNDGKELQSRAVVLATGTFLGGKLYRGGERGEGGRVSERAATRLARQLRDLELPVRRLKTGTPPRLDGRTIDWSRLDQQPSDADDWTMSPLEQRVLPQLHCAITRTTAATHDLIRHGLATSPLFTGAIEAGGPRYCPSIEDKVVRFGDRDGHQVFLEPEGVATNLVYPNGISTSLSTEVQTALVRSIPGLERADIVEPGYAVEYDYLDPRHLTHELETREIGKLFCAGQINGTTGYEEAAGQGLVAGANAAGKALELSPLRLERDESYIGVMIDDLVLAGVSEPYRMLTARAEYRLQLRADNATTRLSAKGEALGLLGAERSRFASKYFAEVDRARAGASDVSMAALQELEDDKLYAPYIERQRQETRKRALFGGRSVPGDLDYSSIPGLSNEMRERLSSVRPATIGEAGRIPGVTPAALTALLAAVQKLAA